MKAHLARLWSSLDAMGLAALVLLAAAGAFQFLVVQPLEARSELARENAARQVRKAEPAQNGGAADKVAAVYHFLQKDEETTDWLAKLHGIGLATGVQLKSASYRTESTEGRIQRYEMVLPVSGTYVHLRDFLQRSLAEIPVMSVDQLTLKRENRNDGVVQAELRLTLHIVKS
jgi:Tfp pilus assembly protein PilO